MVETRTPRRHMAGRRMCDCDRLDVRPNRACRRAGKDDLLCHRSGTHTRRLATMTPPPMTLAWLLAQSVVLFPHTEIVSQTSGMATHRYNYADLYRRARALAVALAEGRVRPCARVPTLMST